ncbi:MAG TPA: RluA family pseudouridine synthase [Bacteroidales bacterium]|nr:RluA family pseudouridine synthase [Bacteroidales bacterium]
MKHTNPVKENTLMEAKEKCELMTFLLQNLKQKSRDNIKSLLRNKQILVNGEAVTQFNHLLIPGDRVEVIWSREEIKGPSRNLNIIFEDDYIIVIDKHSGLLSIATGKETYATAYSILSNYVKQKNPANKIFVVHRLDRDTSGVMMFARSEKVQAMLQDNWKDTVTERKYSAVVEGRVEEKEGKIESYIYESKALMMHSTKDPEKGELAITHFRTVKANDNYSLLDIYLETGKKNQIRLHMKDYGHSIAGDKKYGAHGNPIGRLALHAGVLAFTHPVTGKPMRFESKIPVKFRWLLK